MKIVKPFFLILICMCFTPHTYLEAQKDKDLKIKNLPPQWVTDSLLNPELPVEDYWWREFNDRLLDSLIQTALHNNHNLLVAQSRIEQARAAYRSAQGNFYPDITLDAGWQKTQSSLNSSAISYPGLKRSNQYASAGLSTQWEIDIFGSIRNRVKSQKDLYLATQDDYYGVMLSLCAQVASGYTELRSLQQQYIVAQQNMESQAAIVHVTEARYKAGLSSQLDVAQSKSVYYSTKASIPALDAQIAQQINSIAILLGVFPSNIRYALEAPGPLPDYNRIVAVGIPANIIRRRPDIRAAEKTIASYASMVGASRSDYLPKLYLNGSIGFASKEMNKFFNEKSLTYEIAPSLSWTLFQGVQRIQALNSAKSQLKESVEQYNQTLLTAVQEVENAMSGYTNTIKQIIELNQVVYQGEITLRLSLDLYKRGLGTFQNVLDAQRSLLSYENALVTAQGNALSYLIQLYKSLGGGWEQQ